VRHGLRASVESYSLKELEKLHGFARATELRDAAQTISGLSFGDFRTLMLVPKAEEDILSGRLSLKGEKLDAWLLAAKKTSDVKVFSRELYWDGEGVKSH